MLIPNWANKVESRKDPNSSCNKRVSILVSSFYSIISSAICIYVEPTATNGLYFLTKAEA